MAGRDIIVIGGSAGGVQALQRIVAALPPQLEAAVFTVVHFPSDSTSFLPQILLRSGRFPAVHPEDGTMIRHGVIYVAPPDRHLTLQHGHVRLSRGPRENGHRPAVDPLFRSAARAYGARVIGVVLSGNLDDGTAGLAAVRRHGGLTVVQDPEDAMYAGMPASAIQNVDVDHVVPAAGIAALLAALVDEPLPPAEAVSEPRDDLEVGIAELEAAALEGDERPGTPSGYSCPSCHGSLFEIQEGEVVRFRCRVGHAFGSDTLLHEQAGAVEGALWTALQSLKERAAMARRMERRMAERGNARSADRFRDQADDADSRASVIREVLRTGASMDQRFEASEEVDQRLAGD
ncbi:MAG TPA: chemotaxis protein CheB [Longimicrobiaceae bacterium]|nr:chemotaxis protein CheB [Longimicrobiaceae bacterium]